MYHAQVRLFFDFGSKFVISNSYDLPDLSDKFTLNNTNRTCIQYFVWWSRFNNFIVLHSLAKRCSNDVHVRFKSDTGLVLVCFGLETR